MLLKTRISDALKLLANRSSFTSVVRTAACALIRIGTIISSTMMKIRADTPLPIHSTTSGSNATCGVALSAASSGSTA